MVRMPKAFERKAEIDDEVLFERHRDVGKTPAQIREIVCSEGVGDHGKANEIISDSGQVRVESRPVLADENRITPHRVAAG